MGVWQQGSGPKVCSRKLWGLSCACAGKPAAEPAGKPGSVVDSHSSRRNVTVTLKQPTRTRRGPRHEVPSWSCSRWGLPYRSVARLAVRSYRTISPLPDPLRAIGGIFLLHFPSACAAQALPGTLPCGARTFLGIVSNDATVWPTPPCALSHAKGAFNAAADLAPPPPARQKRTTLPGNLENPTHSCGSCQERSADVCDPATMARHRTTPSKNAVA